MADRIEYPSAAWPPAELRAGGFLLRAISQADWAVEAELSRDPEVLRWTFQPEAMDEAAARQRIRHHECRASEGATQRFVIVDDQGTSLGTCGIGRLHESAPEIFFTLLKRARGRGAATEAAIALCRWAFDHGRHVVALMTIKGNPPSEAVARRAGFVPAGDVERRHRGNAVLMTRWVLEQSRWTSMASGP